MYVKHRNQLCITINLYVSLRWKSRWGLEIYNERLSNLFPILPPRRVKALDEVGGVAEEHGVAGGAAATGSNGVLIESIQSWALSVSWKLFNNKKVFVSIFLQVNLTGSGLFK